MCVGMLFMLNSVLMIKEYAKLCVTADDVKMCNTHPPPWIPPVPTGYYADGLNLDVEISQSDATQIASLTSACKQMVSAVRCSTV